MRGYSILELLLVIAIMGLATALVGPPMYRMIGSWQRADTAERILGELAALPSRAASEGRTLTLGPGLVGADVLEDLPESWSLRLDQRLTVRANGACSASSGTLSAGTVDMRFDLVAPYCRIRWHAEQP